MMSSALWGKMRRRNLCWDRTGCTAPALKISATSGRGSMAWELHPQCEELSGTAHDEMLEVKLPLC